jgi:hypothetical protein
VDYIVRVLGSYDRGRMGFRLAGSQITNPRPEREIVMQKIQIVIRRYDGNDTEPKWRIMQSVIVTEDFTPAEVTDTMEIISNRVNSALGRV